MCIIFFKSHHDGPREHYVGSLHCAHLDCAGTFEAHSKYLLEEPRADCADCLAADGDQVDQDVCSYAAIPHCELAYEEGTGWVKVGEKAGAEGAGQGEENAEAGGQGQEEEYDEGGSYHGFRSLSDVDSITSHWRLDPPRRAQRSAAAPRETSPAPAPCASSAAAEPFETHSAHDPHEMQEVGSPYHENGSNQDPNIPDCADSPNTLEHRHLVNKQLKAHTKRISRHRRQNSRPGRLQQRHGRQNSRPAVDVVAPHPYTFAVGGNPVHQGLPGGHVPGYLAVPQLGQALTWGWGPVPPPHLRGMYPPF